MGIFGRKEMGSKNGSNMDNIVGLLGKGTEIEGKLI